MREILFRAKHINIGKWVEGDLVREQDIFGKIRTMIYQIKGDGLFNKVEVDPSTVCQYTGLQDKDGKKIFEGDILKCPAYMPERDICICRWVDYSDTYSIRGFGMFCDEKLVGSDEWGDFEVIGNIYDNPELLKEHES